MPIPLDFSRSNQTLARFNQYLMYDLLDQKKSDRDVALMNIQDRLMRERQVEAGQIDIGVAEYKSALSNDEAWTKAKLEFAKQPRFTYLNSWANMAGDTTVPEKYHQTIRDAVKARAEILGPVADAFQQASVGKMSWKNAYATLDAAGIGGITDVMQEAGTGRRANLAAEVDREKLGVEREKLTDVGAGRTQAAQDKVTERYLKWIEDTTQFLVGEGVQGEAITGDMPIYLEAKARDPLSSEDRGKALTYLQQLRAQVLRQGPDSLTDGNISFITKVWNTAGVQGFVSDKLKKVEGGMQGSVAASAGKGAPAPVERRGGLPSPETGATTAEYDQALGAVRQTWINQKAAEFIKAVYGETPSTPEIQQEAMRYATEYVDTRIMPSLMKR